MAKKCGATVKDVFWTLGEHDIASGHPMIFQSLHLGSALAPLERSYTDHPSVYTWLAQALCIERSMTGC